MTMDIKDRFYEKFKLYYKLQPPEYGVIHIADQWVWMLSGLKEFQQWTLQVMESQEDIVLARGLMLSIGRLPWSFAEGWGVKVAAEALRNGNVELRDTAISAIGLWGTKEAAEVLKDYKDEIDWLNKYVQDTVEDILK